MQKITLPYLLTVAAPIKRDSNGLFWADRLWAKDLALHLDYIERLTLISPQIAAEQERGDVSLSESPFTRINFVAFPRPNSHIDALRLLPSMISIMWHAVRANEIVHTGFGFWPISEGLLSSPIARLHGKFLITNVESSFWRATDPTARLFDRARSATLERLNRLCIQSANVRYFTSQAYLEDFLPKDAKSAYVTPATWIDDSNVLDEVDFLSDCSGKTGPVRLLFAGRLTKEKGISLFLEAAHMAQPNVTFSVIGEGPMKDACAAADNVELHALRSYGESFFHFLRQFDAIVVPSISDEQPRIIFDAFSQGIPVLGSDTGGISELVKDNLNGKLFTTNSVTSLMTTIGWCASNRTKLQEMGRNALQTAKRSTHLTMHQYRNETILRELATQIGRL